MLSHALLLVVLWPVARQATLSMEFSKQGYWSGFPLPTSGDLPDPGIEPTPLKPLASASAGGFLTTCVTRKDHIV